VQGTEDGEEKEKGKPRKVTIFMMSSLRWLISPMGETKIQGMNTCTSKANDREETRVGFENQR
jgi:hypothetical protein